MKSSHGVELVKLAIACMFAFGMFSTAHALAKCPLASLITSFPVTGLDLLRSTHKAMDPSGTNGSSGTQLRRGWTFRISDTEQQSEGRIEGSGDDVWSLKQVQHSPAAMPSKPRPEGLPPGWKEYTTATGATYFYNEISGKTVWEYPSTETGEDATSASSGPPLFLSALGRDSSRSDVDDGETRVSDSEPAQAERRGSFLMRMLKKNKSPKFDDKSPRVDAPEPRGRLTSYDSSTPSSLKNSKSFSALTVKNRDQTGQMSLAQVVASFEDSPPETPTQLRHRSASFDPSCLPAGLSPPSTTRASESAVGTPPKPKRKGQWPRNAIVRVNTSRRKSNPDTTPPPLPLPPGARRPTPEPLAIPEGESEGTPEKSPPPLPPKSPVHDDLPVPDKKPPAAPSSQLFRLFGSASRHSVSDDADIIKPAHPNIHYATSNDDEALVDAVTVNTRLEQMDWDERVRCIVDIGLALHFLHILPQPLFIPGLCPDHIALSETGAFQVVVDQRVLRTNAHATETGALIGNIHTCRGAGYLHASDLQDLAKLTIFRRQYIAPELFRGSMSETSDVWALGVIAAELLTGVEVFDPAHIPSSIVDRVIPTALELEDEEDEACPHRASVVYADCEAQGWPEAVVTAMLRLIAACCRPAASDRAGSSELLQRVAAVEQAIDR